MNLARAVRMSGDGGQEGRHLARKKGPAGVGPKIRTPSACDTTLPACDSSAEISVIDAPCETYKTCVAPSSGATPRHAGTMEGGRNGVEDTFGVNTNI